MRQRSVHIETNALSCERQGDDLGSDGDAMTDFFGPDEEVIIHRGMRSRGWIINSYAQVEYMLADAVLRCRSLPAYQHLPATVPYQPSSRGPRFQAVLDAEGPIAEDRDDLQAVLDTFTAAANRRHILVHGFCSVRVQMPVRVPLFHFIKLEPQPGKDDAVQTLILTIEDLEAIGEATSADATRALTVFQRLHRRMGWEADGITKL